MTKHYQRRMEREGAATDGSQSNGSADRTDKRKSWRHSTLGSLNFSARTKPVLDGSGAEVESDRVILYIHGMLCLLVLACVMTADMFRRRSVLLLLARLAPIPDRAACAQGRCPRVRAELQAVAAVSLRKLRRVRAS